MSKIKKGHVVDHSDKIGIVLNNTDGIIAMCVIEHGELNLENEIVADIAENFTRVILDPEKTSEIKKLKNNYAKQYFKQVGVNINDLSNYIESKKE